MSDVKDYYKMNIGQKDELIKQQKDDEIAFCKELKDTSISAMCEKYPVSRYIDPGVRSPIRGKLKKQIIEEIILLKRKDIALATNGSDFMYSLLLVDKFFHFFVDNLSFGFFKRSFLISLSIRLAEVASIAYDDEKAKKFLGRMGEKKMITHYLRDVQHD